MRNGIKYDTGIHANAAACYDKLIRSKTMWIGAKIIKPKNSAPESGRLSISPIKKIEARRVCNYASIPRMNIK